MAKAKTKVNVRKLIGILLAVFVIVILVWRLLFHSNASDLQNLLQNLPKEITQSINIAASNQHSDSDIVEQIEKLKEEVLKLQEDNSRQFAKQRKILESKLKDLKQPPPEANLRERLAFQFEYNADRRFPAIVWQTWNDQVPKGEQSELKQKWESENPGFAHELLNDELAEAMIRYYYSRFPEIIEAYTTLPSIILKVDFFKYLILLVRGGVYADADVTPIQAIPNWIPEDIDPKKIGLIVGIEHDAITPDWKTKYVRRLQFGTWILQAKPGHPVIRDIVAEITENTLKRKTDEQLNVNLRNALNIMSWTGSSIWTDAIFRYFNDFVKSGVNEKITWKFFHGLKSPKLLSDVLVFPQHSFNAPSVIDPTDELRSEYLVHHKFNKVWKST